MIKVHLESLLKVGMIGYRMYVAKEGYGGRSVLMLGSSLTLKTLEPYSVVSDKEAFLDDAKFGYGGSNDFPVQDYLQAVVDAAWEVGIKPKQLEDQKNELSAIRYHLEDMRKIAGVDQAAELPDFASGLTKEK